MRAAGHVLILAVVSSGLVLAAPRSREVSDTDPTLERAYLAQSQAAMTRMMDGMSMKPLGDVDRDFVRMMIPHHQGAIDMAMAVLRYGRNQRIRRLAQEIIVDQQQEIAAMRSAIGDPLPPAAAAATTPGANRPKP